jgi:uncharacterized protein YndB with AHSA1/START domain
MSSPVATPSLVSHEARLEFTLHAPPAKVWSALVKDTDVWWPKTFHTSPKTKRVVLEPKLGGMMGEITGPGEGLVWHRVIGVEKHVSLLLAGHLLPPWAPGPATTILRLTLTPAGKAETKLVLVEYTFGVLGDCNTVEGWRELFGRHFVPHVNRPVLRRKR